MHAIGCDILRGKFSSERVRSASMTLKRPSKPAKSACVFARLSGSGGGNSLHTESFIQLAFLHGSYRLLALICNVLWHRGCV
jgi:hypothetical protein